MELMPCPFCGEPPELSTLGTWIEISCCANMSRQKSDYMTIDERKRWDNRTHKYDGELEDKVLGIVANEWNTRMPDPTNEKEATR